MATPQTRSPAWQGRAAGLASTSGRHAAPAAVPRQPAARGALQGGRRSRTLLGAGRASAIATGPQPAVGSRALVMGAGGLLSRRPPAAPQLAQLDRGAPPPPPQPQPAVTAPPAAAADVLPAAAEPTPSELQRRQKISQANKGRVPWNKGRKHPPETIARIKQATLRAMQRPDVIARLRKANEKREPHSAEAKAKIREKLRARGAAAREALAEQARLIVADLAASEDPADRELAAHPSAARVVSGLAWQFFKARWGDAYERGWREDSEFRQRVMGKLRRVCSSAARPEPHKRARLDRVKLALGHLRKVEEAREKLAAGEAAISKLQAAKAAFASDPARLRQALAAEEKAAAMTAKLREQVAQLEEALLPLQAHLDEARLVQQQEGGAEAGAGGAQQPSLEARLEAAAAARASADAGAGAAPQHANGIVNGWGGAAAAAALQAGEAVPAVNGHANEHAAAAPAARKTSLPWQQ